MKLLNKKDAEKCVNFALQVRTIAPVSKEHEQSLKEHLRCEHTRYLPKSLNRLRYLGEVDVADQQDFDYIEHFRVDNLKHSGRETKFTLKEKTLVRIDGVEHAQLSFFIKILRGDEVVASQEGAILTSNNVRLIPAIFAVLEPGDYVMKIEFVAREAEILTEPCQAI